MLSLPVAASTPPDFTLPDQNGEHCSLASFKGHSVLLYFYPKDDTPGCTKEACALRDEFPQFDDQRAVVLGISPDSVASHKRFEEKYQLPFLLLSDEGAQVAKLYGVWGEKKMMGRTYEGIKRTSFLISPEGKIVKVYENVKPEAHAAEVLADLAAYTL